MAGEVYSCSCQHPMPKWCRGCKPQQGDFGGFGGLEWLGRTRRISWHLLCSSSRQLGTRSLLFLEQGRRGQRRGRCWRGGDSWGKNGGDQAEDGMSPTLALFALVLLRFIFLGSI